MNILDLIFPKFCAGCGRIGDYLCANCTSDILQGDLVCPNCERPSMGGQTHPLCYKKYGLDGLWSLGVYQGNLKKLIHKLKYRFVKNLENKLTDITIEYWARNTPLLVNEIKKQPELWCITAVPLHLQRINYRGFNQAELLGKNLSARIGLKYQNLLKRVKNTRQQVGLESYRRNVNIRNAFAIAGESPHPQINVLLIDDVWTTGSTLKECCYVLKRAGVKKVWAITLAR